MLKCSIRINMRLILNDLGSLLIFFNSVSESNSLNVSYPYLSLIRFVIIMNKNKKPDNCITKVISNSHFFYLNK
jgi:hypothetical protein